MHMRHGAIFVKRTGLDKGRAGGINATGSGARVCPKELPAPGRCGTFCSVNRQVRAEPSSYPFEFLNRLNRYDHRTAPSRVRRLFFDGCRRRFGDSDL